MNPTFRRYWGVCFTIFGIAGILLSSLGILGIWRLRTLALTKFYDTTQLIGKTLSATADGFSILNDTLDAASETMDSTSLVTLSMAETLNDINTFTSSFIRLLNFGLPGGLMGDNLEDANQNLSVTETELINTSTNIDQVSESLKQAQIAVIAYQDTLVNAQQQFENLQMNGPKWITAATWVVTFGLIWLVIVQTGMLVQGIDYFLTPKTGD